MTMPLYVHPHQIIHVLQDKYDLGGVFYLDLWPLGGRMMVMADPKAAQQATVQSSLPKAPVMREALVPLAGELNMVTLEGKEWRRVRSMFNPGFSLTHLMTLVPEFVEDALVFVEILKEIAEKKGLTRLEELTTRFTIDIIGRAVLAENLNSQRSENELVSAFRDQCQHLPLTGDIWALVTKVNPYAMYRRWKNARTMDRYLRKVLDERFASKDGKTVQKKNREKYIIDLALDTYIEDYKEKETSRLGGIDETFMELTISQ